MNNKQNFSALLKPGCIGKMEIRNRIAMAPMGTYLAARDGTVTDRLKSYYEERARGGAGLIIIEIAAIDHPRGRGMIRQLGISEDKFMPGLAELAGAIHKHGAKAGIQLHHAGRIAAPFLSGGHEAVAPSAIPLVPEQLGMARELTEPEIGELVQRYGQAALRAKQAGIDGVEIHAGHGYLIDQFLSRSSNFRQDKYGGKLENRMRMLLEIVNAVREQVGPEFPVWCRIDGREYGIENGITVEESQEIASKLEQSGVDALNVSGYGGSVGAGFTTAPLVYQPCFLLPVVENIKKTVKIPVIAAGRIDPHQAENILRRGEADFIAMGRPLLADPELPLKITQGRSADIRKCIYCYTCVHQIFVRNNVCCAVNPAVGKESEPLPVPSQAKKKVLIAGGGPAGMTAAINAAARNHDVMLVEKENYLGGSLTLASIVRPENADLTKYLVDQVKQSNIKVKLRTKFNLVLVKRMQPDVLVIATGAVHHNLDIPGIDNNCVVDGDALRQMLSGRMSREISRKLKLHQRIIMATARKLLKPWFKPNSIRRLTHLWMPLGNKITIVGAGMIGCELADFLAERGRKVTMVETSDQIATEMPLPMKWRLLADLERRQVAILTEVKLGDINAKGINILTKDGVKRTIPADNIVIATGSEPNSVLSEKFQGKAREVYMAGDCTKLGFTKEAISEGTKIGSTI